MLKKITTKQDQKIEAAAQAQFATDVIGLYRVKLTGKEDTHPDPDVRAVACGLALLKQVIDSILEKTRNNSEARVASGVIQADDIITALTTTGRRDHPLFKHIASLQASIPTTGANEQQRRAMLAGVALAYQEAAGCDLRPATVAVCHGIRANDFVVTSEQLRKWVERNKTAARAHAKRFLADAKALGGPAAALPRCVIIVGRTAMSPLVVIPS